MGGADGWIEQWKVSLQLFQLESSIAADVADLASGHVQNPEAELQLDL